MYSDKVIQHFKNPQNMGKLKNPDGVGQVGNPLCGDIMYIYIKIGKNKKGQEIIKDIGFETMGCVAAIATSSMITELAKGKALPDAQKITIQDVADALGSLPPIKMHCSQLAVEGIREAIEDYRNKT